MISTQDAPRVSVVVPTHQRRRLLERSIESVRAQTYAHWELVVSDDEEGEGSSWQYLASVSGDDPRIRPVKNAGVHGQVENTNNALRQARGEWIKLLHDDDILKPTCLAELVETVDRFGNGRSIACVTCGVERYRNGRVVTSRRRAGWPLVEIIPQAAIHTAMYMAEDAGGAAPSQKMIHRRVLDRGVSMEHPPALRMLVDSWFNALVGQCGDLLIYRKALVEWHQGAHDSVTQRWGDDSEDEITAFRHMLWELISDRSDLPEPELMGQTIALQRGLWHLSRLDVSAAIRLVSTVRDARAVLEYVRWLLHNSSKGKFSRATRLSLMDRDGQVLHSATEASA